MDQAWASVAALGVLVFANPARSQTQVSDEFVRVSKELGKRVASGELKKVCEKLGESDRPVCEQVTADVARIFAMAVDQKIDQQALSQMLVDLEGQLAQAATAHASQSLIQNLFTQTFESFAADHPGCADSLKAEVPALARCLVSQVLPVAKVDACTALASSFAKTATACGIPFTLPPPGENPVAAILKAVQTGVQNSDKPSAVNYKALVTLTQVSRLYSSRSNLGTVYAAVSEAADFQDILLRAVGDVENEHVNVDSRLEKDLTLWDKSPCNHGDATKTLQDWRGRHWAVFHSLGSAVAAGRALPPAALDAIPTRLPDVTCSGSQPIAGQGSPGSGEAGSRVGHRLSRRSGDRFRPRQDRAARAGRRGFDRLPQDLG